MTIDLVDDSIPQKPLRVWPGAAAVAVQWLAWFGIPIVLPETGPYGIFVGLCAGLAVVAWWLFFSRAPWSERVGAIALMVVTIVATKRLVHESMAGGGMGMLLYIYAVPALSLALVAAAVVARRLAKWPRRATILGATVLACGVFTLLRTGGITGEGDSDLHWRWTQTPEQRLLAQAGKEREPVSASNEAKSSGEWPGFRGPLRDGVIRGARIETDWTKSPPVEMWRRPIGPGWSSFAVRGGVLYTQEQRGEEEIVAAYNVATGEPVWIHRDATRFYESNAGAGPRATPTLSNDRVYTFGATGILSAINARDGVVLWSRNAATETGKKVPHWGFASSPLVMNDLVIVAVRDQLAAYDATSGNPRWVSPGGGGGGYSSPHLVTIFDVAQILLLRGGGVIGVSPADGTLLWEHSWEPGLAGIVQPAQTADGNVLITASDEMGGIGMRRIAVASGPGGWTVEERWTSRGLKPYYNDFVVHQGHAFGFDNSILACIDLQDGTRKWKGGRYGHGQLLLLTDQDLLLVLSEEGELALVKATADAFAELARFPAIKGKTWNHPVLAGDILLVRNSEEMAALRLSLADR
jgi:outer membrane protein assembly factor BamB